MVRSQDGNMISVCAPYWNRPAMLERMYENYERLYRPHLPVEYSICDDGSPLPALPLEPHGNVMRLPDKRTPLNPCVPINRAVNASRGDIVVLTNPEIEHKEPVLGEMLLLLTHEDDYVIALCRHDDGGGKKMGWWLSGPLTRYKSRGIQPLPPGGHLHFLVMFHRTLWEKAGGFDEDYRHGACYDDGDWLWRVYEAGARFKLTEGVVWHFRRQPTAWGMPSNRDLFNKKWPAKRRDALVKEREGAQASA